MFLARYGVNYRASRYGRPPSLVNKHEKLQAAVGYIGCIVFQINNAQKKYQHGANLKYFDKMVKQITCTYNHGKHGTSLGILARNKGCGRKPCRNLAHAGILGE